MKWEIKHKLKINPPAGGEKSKIEELVDILLGNRGIKTKKDIEAFIHPKLEDVTVDTVRIDKTQLKKAINRIKKAIEKKEQIVVFGDYDVDGITGSAILWETLHSLGANALPYIPHRIEEGYGLSIKGIQNVILSRAKDLASARDSSAMPQNDKVSLIITVDNGIVANEAVTFAKMQGIDVIITDHHIPSKKLPDAYAIVHTTTLCGAGVAWLLAQQFKVQSSKFKVKEDSHLELVALATIADMVPLTGANRILVVYGLQALQKTRRLGLRALFEEAGIDPASIGVYEVGHIIAPRLNASGRMASAMDSLRLLCTKDRARAMKLAVLLGKTNRERQTEMIATAEHAIEKVKSSAFAKATADKQKSKVKSLLFVAHEQYQQGTIGLVAGKLVETFYRPAIVVSIGEKESKASARSVKGFNIIEFLRQHAEYFVNVGGHPMAAGFTIATEKITLLQQALEQSAEKVIDADMLSRKLRIDCELSFDLVSDELYHQFQQLAPFGIGNPEPTFVSRNVVVEDVRIIGRDRKHLKMNIKNQKSNSKYEAVGFGMGEMIDKVRAGQTTDIVYTLDRNVWNGTGRLQLKLRDIKLV